MDIPGLGRGRASMRVVNARVGPSGGAFNVVHPTTTAAVRRPEGIGRTGSTQPDRRWPAPYDGVQVANTGRCSVPFSQFRQCSAAQGASVTVTGVGGGYDGHAAGVGGGTGAALCKGVGGIRGGADRAAGRLRCSFAARAVRGCVVGEATVRLGDQRGAGRQAPAAAGLPDRAGPNDALRPRRSQGLSPGPARRVLAFALGTCRALANSGPLHSAAGGNSWTPVRFRRNGPAHGGDAGCVRGGPRP